MTPEKQARLKELLAEYPEPWVIEKEPHDYNDGTKEFTHVRYRTQRYGKPHEDDITVSIGEYVTPDLAELLILLRDCADEFMATMNAPTMARSLADRDKLELAYLGRSSVPLWGGHLKRGEPASDPDIPRWVELGLIEQVGTEGYVLTEKGRAEIAA